MGKETSGNKLEDPHSVKSNEMDTSFSNLSCATPSRIAREIVRDVKAKLVYICMEQSLKGKFVCCCF